MEEGKKQADESVREAARAGESLTTIAQAIQGINDMNTQIASAAEEQSAVSEEINRNIINISQLAGQATQASEDAASTGVEFTRLAEELRDIVRQFKR
jgi:methyl-accepting chemotaxis protein